MYSRVLNKWGCQTTGGSKIFKNQLREGAKFIGAHHWHSDRGAKSFSGEKIDGTNTFSGEKNDGAETFQEKKMTGPILFVRKKMTGLELFLR